MKKLLKLIIVSLIVTLSFTTLCFAISAEGYTGLKDKEQNVDKRYTNNYGDCYVNGKHKARPSGAYLIFLVDKKGNILKRYSATEFTCDYCKEKVYCTGSPNFNKGIVGNYTFVTPGALPVGKADAKAAKTKITNFIGVNNINSINEFNKSLSSNMFSGIVIVKNGELHYSNESTLPGWTFTTY